MANLTTSPNLFGGQYKIEAGISTAAVAGANDINDGLFQVIPSIKDRFILPLLDGASNLQQASRCAATFGSPASMSNIAIDVLPFTDGQTYCKDALADTFYADYMAAGVANTTVPQAVVDTLIDLMVATNQEKLSNLRWSGDTASADPDLGAMDGIIVKLVAAGDTINGGTGTVTAANVISKIQGVIAATPSAIRKNKNFAIVLSPEIGSLLEAASANVVGVLNQTPLLTNALSNPSMDYLGVFVQGRIPLYIAQGLSAGYPGVMLAGRFSNDIFGNFVMVTDATSDLQNVLVQDMEARDFKQPNLDIRMTLRMGVGVKRTNEVVLYI